MTAPDSLTIRPANDHDVPALAELAALDSARALAGDVLLAEQDGDVRAAVSLHDGRAIADPFHRTAELVDLLHVRARRSGIELALHAPERRFHRALAARR
jgi:hypothetical protein